MAQGMGSLSPSEYQELKSLELLSTEQRNRQGKQDRYLQLKFRYFINLGKKQENNMSRGSGCVGVPVVPLGCVLGYIDQYVY